MRTLYRFFDHVRIEANEKADEFEQSTIKRRMKWPESNKYLIRGTRPNLRTGS